MSYQVYKLVHFSGIFLVLLAYGSLALNGIRGGAKDAPGRKMAVIMHGVGMFLSLLGGFGLLAKMQIHWPWPGWIYGKIAIWLLLGGGVAVFSKKPGLSKSFLWVAYAIALVGAYLAQYKPF